jgi:hypothetical protein
VDSRGKGTLSENVLKGVHQKSIRKNFSEALKDANGECSQGEASLAALAGSPTTAEDARLPDGSSGVRFHLDVHESIQNIDRRTVANGA